MERRWIGCGMHFKVRRMICSNMHTTDKYLLFQQTQAVVPTAASLKSQNSFTLKKPHSCTTGNVIFE